MARPQTGFHFTVQKGPVPESVLGSSGASLAKGPYLDSGNEAHYKWQEVCRWQCFYQVCQYVDKRGTWGLAFLMCQKSSAPHHLHLLFFRLVCFSNFLVIGEALHLTSLWVIWFRVTIFSLGPSSLVL